MCYQKLKKSESVYPFHSLLYYCCKVRCPGAKPSPSSCVSWVAVMPSCLALNLHTFTPDSLKIFSIFAMSNGNNIVPVRARGLGLDQQQSSYLHLCFQWLTSILIVQSIKCFVANPPKLVVTHCNGMSQYYQWL